MNEVSHVCEKQLRVFSRVVSWRSVCVLSTVCWLKKSAQPRSWQFSLWWTYWRLKPRRQPLSPVALFWRGKGGVRTYRSFCKQTNKKTSSIKRLLLDRKTRPLKSVNLTFFYVWGDARIWTHWNHYFNMHLNYLGPVSCFLHPKPPKWATL